MLVLSPEDLLMQATLLAEYRCTCGKLLFKGVVRTTRIQIKCKRCGALSAFGPSEPEPASNRYGVLVAKDGTILSVSDSITRILGYTPQELESTNIRDLQSYEREEGVALRSHAVIMETHRGKDGRQVPVRVRYEHAGSSPDSVLYTCDVQSPQVLNDAPDDCVAHDLYIEVDTDLCCSFVSDAFAQAVSMRALQLIGTELSALLDPESARTCARLQGDGAAARMPQIFDTVHLKEGGSRALRLHAIPSWRDDGSPRGYTLLFERHGIPA